MAKINGEKLRNKLLKNADCIGGVNTWGEGWNDAMRCAAKIVQKMIAKAEKKAKFKAEHSIEIVDAPMNAPMEAIINKSNNSYADVAFGFEKEGKMFWTSFDGKQVLFDIVERNVNELTLVSRDILCFEPFDVSDNNDYDKSSIKEFLHEEFVSRFNKGFISLLTDEGFYLPSEEEIKRYYPEKEDRVKKFKNEEYWYWTRTPNSSFSHYVRRVSTDGSLSNRYAYIAYGVAPACKIRIK